MPTCPNCGRENPDGFRYCGFCAGPLLEAVPSSEERKVVTVLFCDLVGFTARSDRADPEDVRAVLRPYHARLRQEIQRYGGTVEKFIGDAVMAVFGAPVAHEDDAERAVRTGLGILEAISELNASHPGLDLAIRTGLATGEVLVSLGAKPQEGESIVAGDVVNLAARLQQEATPGTVIVEEMCYRATRHLIDYEELAPVRVKGKSDTVLVWRAVSARSRLGVDVDHETATPFVGRRRDLALLQETYRRVIEGGWPQLVTIVGEPGVGKTRLLFELRKWVHAREELVWWRQGRCPPYGDGITFWALGEIMKAQAGILESDDLEEAEAKLAAAVQAMVEDGSEQEWIRLRLAPLVGVKTDGPSEAGREESFTAWRRFLEALAAVRPLILLFEDVHWADEAMLEFVDHLVEWSPAVPILILCTARPELFQGVPGWGGGKKNKATVTLLPLSPEETTELIAGLLAEAALPPEVQTALLERSGGNPLYAEEFARMLLDRGILERRGGALELAPGVGIPVPETVHALIAARLDLLPPQQKSLLQDASVVGKVFWSGAVASMSGMDEDHVLQALHELANEELIRPARRSSIQDQEEYSFWHILVRDVAYGQIPRATRGRKHRAAAQWTEQLAGDRVGDYSEIVAGHYTEALELAQASGETEETEELRERAARFLVMAGDRSFELDVQRAESHYRGALELLSEFRVERPAAVMKVGRVANLRGEAGEAEEMYREAIKGYEERGDAVGAADAMVHLADLIWGRGNLLESAALLDEAIRVLEIKPPERGLALAFILKSRALWEVSEREEEVLTWAERGLSLAQELDAKALVVRAMGYRALARIGMGEAARGLVEEREALALALSLGLGEETARLYNNVANDVMANGHPGALDLFREGIEFAKRRGLAESAMWIKANLAWALVEVGRWDESLTLVEEVLAASPPQWTRQMAKIAKAKVLIDRGEPDAAASLMQEPVSQARRGDPGLGGHTLALAAQVEWQRGRQDEAQALIEEIERKDPPQSSWDVLEVLRISQWAGDVDLARHFLGGTRPPRVERERDSLLIARSIVAELEGRLEQAAALRDQAAERWGQLGFIPLQGEALLGAGRCLVGQGRADEAKARLDEARNLFEPLGARLFVQEIDELLDQVAALSS